ncbi:MULTISPECIES: acyl-CoA dehydrogenase family protein [unclassified Mycobacterium]|uniref:acyl-CoA dehydrogenase family protein n=1 Tax=unclassified Mycobacterium TaxID=2642494 RepID=UPI0007FF4E16|nr:MULTISPECIES: acyl-CoA dehydrogenase family protein [unclassified Mycobacterium]OBG63498.1 isovaleryl-CoA dehydrogenase [Mycobacterium sp. E188]OBG75288.1 isovaleryl-CoA dehydrogenase [Mycobacterium sp. E3305]OBH34184.1 isovaleryl-CoA dehydrogenase [Mycobacterium sp. E183]
MPCKPLIQFGGDENTEALRTSIREWLADNLADEFRRTAANPDYLPRDAHERAVSFCRKLHEQGWFVPHWPAEYEGGGRGIVEQVVIREELAYAGAPLVNTNGVNMLAPVLFKYGTPEQKAEHLPAIARSERMWAQGYSEPEAGSDLASLRMTARRDGDEYVLDGQKTWTSNGVLADWIFVLARTSPIEDKRQAGISFFLVDLESPGITRRPIRSMTGYPTFAEEFFDGVRVPAANLVGAEGQGWTVGKALLDAERSNVTRAAQAQRYLDELIDWCHAQKGSAHDPLSDPANRIALARAVERVEVGRALSYRVAHLQAAGALDPALPSLSKLYHSELTAELRALGAQILGPAGELMPDDPDAVLDGHFSEGLLLSLLHTIGGGTSEIQRDLISTVGLGMPR